MMSGSGGQTCNHLNLQHGSVRHATLWCSKYREAGGAATTTLNSGEQWDAPSLGQHTNTQHAHRQTHA